MKLRYSLIILAASTAFAPAASIAINFAENTNQAFTGGVNIGPTGINSSNWNSTINRDSGSLEAGTKNNLIDDTGTATIASVTWSSSNVWYNADGTTNDVRKLAVGYLDDGGSGVSITLTDIPYAQYIVYGLLSSDQGDDPNTYTTRDFQVNGLDVLGGTATAYKGVAASWGATGNDWNPLTTTSVGNYWTSTVQTSSTLTVTGLPRSGDERGSISGLIIQQVPEPSSAALLGLAGLALILRRRK